MADRTVAEIRCTPGQREAPDVCERHGEHYYCSACHGWYGVPHSATTGCHSHQAKRGRVEFRRIEHCACRFCEIQRATGSEVLAFARIRAGADREGPA